MKESQVYKSFEQKRSKSQLTSLSMSVYVLTMKAFVIGTGFFIIILLSSFVADGARCCKSKIGYTR